MNPDSGHSTNFEADIAAQFVNQTDTPIFLTGKAGTGKTTFLKNITRSTLKNCVVLAPTGVAAINAGGVTIHSMFGLPTRAFVPTYDAVDPNVANNRSMIVEHFHYNKQKLEVIRNLELLIIDEVSMVRADILDAVSFALQFARKSERPFGGVQVLFIGDMYQLPPVVKEEEWPLLSRYYRGPYFFDSLVFQQIDPVFIELKKVFRQRDRQFIQVLNNIRSQEFEAEDYEILRECYDPEFEPDEPGWITLTTHNRKADAINERELARLEGEEMGFDAQLSGDFSESMYPTESLLRLKKGAQVMFVKNDSSGERRYYNGKIGVVEWLDPYAEAGEQLRVRFPDEDKAIWVDKETWENLRYTVNTDDGKVEQNRIGSFEQYPLRLAWAITIHKSQGLTFEKAIIDAGESFAPGQVYVALSRCTGMEYLKLRSMITGRNIFSDPRITEFSGRIMKEMVLESRLLQGKYEYEFSSVLKVFDFEKIMQYLRDWNKEAGKLKSVDQPAVGKRYLHSNGILQELSRTAAKFRQQLEKIFDSGEDQEAVMQQLRDRCGKAVNWFAGLLEPLVQDWESHISEERKHKGRKKYTAITDQFVRHLGNRLEALAGLRVFGEKVFVGELRKRETAKPAKTDTYEITLELLEQDMEPQQVADTRNMALSTIEGHISRLIRQGRLDIRRFMKSDEIEAIRSAVSDRTITAGEVMSQLNGSVSWTQIRWVMADLEKK